MARSKFSDGRLAPTIEMLNESVAALTAEIYTDHLLCDKFLLRYAYRDSHTGRLHVIIRAAMEFEHQAFKRRIHWDEPHDWILCIEDLAARLTLGEDVNWDMVFMAGLKG